MAMVLCALATPAAARASDFEHPASPDTSQQLSPLDVNGPGTTGSTCRATPGRWCRAPSTRRATAASRCGSTTTCRATAPRDALPDPGLLRDPESAGLGDAGAAECTDTAAPSSLITGARVRRHFVRVLGTARDAGCAGLRRVSVSVARKVGKRRCRFLRRSGRFGHKRRCAKHRFIPATGTARWRLRVKGRMPVGRYVATARARDLRDNLEGPGERVRFRRRA